MKGESFSCCISDDYMVNYWILNFLSISFLNHLKLSRDEASFRRERLYVNKLNVILVQVRNVSLRLLQFFSVSYSVLFYMCASGLSSWSCWVSLQNWVFLLWFLTLQLQLLCRNCRVVIIYRSLWSVRQFCYSMMLMCQFFFSFI